MRRSDSYAAPTQQTLKRAPSFGANSIAGGVSTPKPIASEKQAQDPESDDEEKVRQTKVKRPRTRSTHASEPGAPDKKREKKLQVQNPKDAASKTVKATNKSHLQKRLRSGSMFGPELPQPQPKSSLPIETPKTLSPATELGLYRGASASPPPGTGAGTKTLRRVKTTAFNLGSCPTARRISFGSLAVPAEEAHGESASATDKDDQPKAASALGSAFQMS